MREKDLFEGSTVPRSIAGQNSQNGGDALFLASSVPLCVPAGPTKAKTSLARKAAVL